MCLNKKQECLNGCVCVCVEQSSEVEWCQCQCSPSLLTLSWWLPSKCLLLTHTHTLPHKDLTSSCARATALSASRVRPRGWVTPRVFPESPLYPPLDKPTHTPHRERVHQTPNNVERCLHEISYRQLYHFYNVSVLNYCRYARGVPVRSSIIKAAWDIHVPSVSCPVMSKRVKVRCSILNQIRMFGGHWNMVLDRHNPNICLTFHLWLVSTHTSP